MGLLANIQLTEDQEKEFVTKFDTWKKEERSKIESEFKGQFENKLNEAENVIQKLRSDKKKTRITESGELDFTDEESVILKKQLTEWKEKIQEKTEEALGDRFLDVYKKGEDKLKKNYFKVRKNLERHLRRS